MKKLLLIGAVVVVLLIGLVGGGYWLYRRFAVPTAELPTPQMTVVDEEASITGEPAVGLDLNYSGQAHIWPGTPLIIGVYVRNPRAMNEAAENTNRQAQMAELKQRAAAGDTAAASPELQQQLAKTVQVTTVTLGDGTRPWSDLVRLVECGGQPLPWKARLIGAAPNSVKLDAETTASLRYVVAPEETRKMAPREYQVCAQVTVEGGAGWKGTATSDPVTLQVEATPSEFTPEEREQTEIALAQYFTEIGNLSAAQMHAQAALAANPGSVAALVSVAEVAERNHDDQAALESYEQALAAARATPSENTDGPQYLVIKTAELRRRIASRK